MEKFSIATKYSHTMYRCDEFTKTHNGKHVVFVGDSFACGDGLEKEDTWCYKVYTEMSKDTTLSGYYNLGMSGASITECIDQFFKYCGTYTNPDVVFFITTEMDRDLRYTTTEQQDFFIHRLYYYLDLYCKSNNIALYSFSWLKSSGMIKDQPKRYTWKVNGVDVLRPLWTEQVSNQKKLCNVELLKDFDSFYDYSSKEMIDSVYEFDNKTETKTKSLWADDGVHPGTSFHDFYAKFIYTKYLENK